MQHTEMAHRIGRLEGEMMSAHIHGARQWEVVMILLRERKHTGKRRHLTQYVAMAITAGASLFGVALPEKLAELLKALMH